MINVSEIFEVKYGHSLELNRLIQTEYNEGFPFISRVSGNNGVSAFVEEIQGIKPFNGNVLTCALGGNGVMSVFLQKQPFYSGRDVACLIPKIHLTDIQLLFYCYCLNINKFRFNYGRQANKTLPDLLIPPILQIPEWVNNIDTNIFEGLDQPVSLTTIDLSIKEWKKFYLVEFFDMTSGKFYYKHEYDAGDTPYISASNTNNGVMQYIDRYPDFKGNCITIGKVGCTAFYQHADFCATSDVTILKPKESFNKYIGLFISTIINKESYRWNYGRQIRLGDCMRVSISLPSNHAGTPDWQFMEDYIKSLPYSSSI